MDKKNIFFTKRFVVLYRLVMLSIFSVIAIFVNSIDCKIFSCCNIHFLKIILRFLQNLFFELRVTFSNNYKSIVLSIATVVIDLIIEHNNQNQLRQIVRSRLYRCLRGSYQFYF